MEGGHQRLMAHTKILSTSLLYRMEGFRGIISTNHSKPRSNLMNSAYIVSILLEVQHDDGQLMDVLRHPEHTTF